MKRTLLQGMLTFILSLEVAKIENFVPPVTNNYTHKTTTSVVCMHKIIYQHYGKCIHRNPACIHCRASFNFLHIFMSLMSPLLPHFLCRRVKFSVKGNTEVQIMWYFDRICSLTHTFCSEKMVSLLKK